jgi:hypothetical protein
MIRFLSFLTEAAIGALSAHQGIAFEVSSMKALKNGEYPTNFRDKEGKKPADVEHEMKSRLGSNEHGIIENEGKKAAEALKQHISQLHPGYQIHDVTWTSNPSDVQRYHEKESTAGQQTRDDNADYVIKLRHPKTGDVRHISVSSKRGSESAKTPGHNTLAQLTGVSEKPPRGIEKHYSEKLNSLLDKHISGYSGMSSEKKADAFRNFNNPKVAEQARDIARERGLETAKHYHQQFSKLNTNQIKEAVKSIAGAGSKSFETHLKVASKSGKVTVSAPDESINHTLNNMKSFHVAHENNKVIFHGIDHEGKTHKLANIEFRSKSLNSSPHIPYIGTKVLKGFK